MPKRAQYTVRWSPQQSSYLLADTESSTQPASVQPDAWLQWLNNHHTFAFHGHSDAINVLKEQRGHHSEGYWYAYRRLDGRMIKRYAGRTDQLSIEHLEEIAFSLSCANNAHEEQKQPPLSYSAPAQSEPLLLPKLQLPRPQKSLLHRDRLLDLLDKSLEHKLTIIAGPAGYGKTTLVSQWVAAQSAHTNAPALTCVTLDEDDNDPIRFWHYIIAACQQISPTIGKEALALLLAHRLPPFKPLEMMLTSLLNDLSKLEQPALLVLDDFHTMDSPQVMQTLAFFLEHLPTTFHLLLLIRGDCPFSLARLRASNELLELYPSSFAFSLEETSAFFAQEVPFPLALNNIRQIYERMDGWPTGMRLLARDLKGAKDPAEIEHTLAAFTGSHWSIQDYFLKEILYRLTTEQQEFLLQTCILPRFNATLCDAIIGRTDSAFQITTLREGDLFLVPINDGNGGWEGWGGWLRYVSLFAEALRQEANQRLGDDRLRRFAARASVWYEEHHFLPEAIETALAATDFPRAATLMGQFTTSRRQGNLSTIPELYDMHRWLEKLPSEEIEHNPDLCVQYALSLLFLRHEGQRVTHKRAHIYDLLQKAEQQWRDQNNTARLAEVFAFRALLARQDGHLLQAITWARQSLAWLPPENRGWHNVSLSVMGFGEILSGNIQDGEQFLLQAQVLAEQQGNHVYARAIRGMLAWACMEQGELRSAAEQLRQIQAEARMQEDRDDISRTQLVLAEIAYQWNDLAAAEQYAQEALTIGEQMHTEDVEVRAIMVLAQLAHAQGQSIRALQLLTARLARTQAGPSPASHQLYRELQAAQASIALACGELTIVNRWLTSLEQNVEVLPLLQRQREQLLQARLLLFQGKVAEAIDTLHSLHTAAAQTSHHYFRYELEIVLILAYTRQGQQEKAHKLLRELLETTRGEGYLRLFLDAGQEMADLLHKLLPPPRERADKLNPYIAAYAKHILRLFSQQQSLSTTDDSSTTHPLLELLSPQEQKVLRLLAAGNSNAEIARQLVVSINTVRTQVQSIYRKLNVNNRVEATTIANRLALVASSND